MKIMKIFIRAGQNCKSYIKKLINKESLEFIQHAKNYVSARFFAKGLSFISIPIFTRLLTPNDYGKVAIFTTMVSVFTILLKLNIHGSVTRYYYEETKDFETFLGSNLIFIFLFNLGIVSIIYNLRESLSDVFEISSYIFIIAVLVSLFKIPLDIFLSYLQASKESKKYSFISVAKSILILGVAIIWTYLLMNNRYLGKMYSYLLVTFLISLFGIYKLVKIADFNFKLKHLKYSLGYGIPLIPHALSGFILGYFDQIIINQLTGSANTGLYSFAYKIGMIIKIIISAMDKSWVPIFFEKMKNNAYDEINNLAYDYSNYICFIAICLIIFSQEIVVIMADKSYYQSLSLIPIIVLGGILYFFYMLYNSYSFYRKRTHLISVATLLAGVINIGLNYWLIPKFGYQIAAVTTLISYFLLSIFHYANVKFILKEKEIIPLIIIIPNFLVLIIIVGVYLLGYYNLNNYFNLITLKFILISVAFYYFIFKE